MSGRALERRIVTVLFADLVGFTSLSERLDAEDVSIVQDAYFGAVRDAIDRHGGVLEKFVGDAVMAVFGAPRVRDDDAERAVAAGLALVAAVERLGAQLGLEPEALRLRVGVNSGETVYGEATAERGPVTGDAVNVAARLQAAAAPGSVVVGEVTALAVGEAVEVEPVGALELKGKAAPVLAWRVVAFRPERSRDEALGGLRAPTIGRERELARLLAGLGASARATVVVAPPGVGKTRLLVEVAAACDAAGAVVFRAQLRPDLLSPFAPVGQLVRSVGLPDAARLRAGGLSEARAEVVREALSSVVAPVAAAPAAGAEERDRLFAAWLDGLDALAGGRPAAWLVEDLHWASPDLLAFLDHATAGGKRLLVATARPALLDTAADWCARAELLHLAPLPPADVTALVRALVGEALPSELVERVAARSAGNALFVEELLRTWIGTGILARSHTGGWTLVAEPDEVGVPPTVQAIYAAQLDDLPAPARTAARHSSVAGRRFPLDGLPALRVADAGAAVDVLARRALVGEPRDDAALGATLRFRHALLRDAAYASLARGDRARLHLGFADWLAARPADALPAVAEVVARHYAAALESAPALVSTVGGRTRAELASAAAGWFERAARVAAGLAAWESARVLAQQSLELTPEADGGLRAGRLELLAQATVHGGRLEDAEAHLREALALHRAALARDGVASVAEALGRLLHAQARFVEAEQLARGVLEELGEPADGAAGRVLLVLAQAVLAARDAYEQAAAHAAAALEIARGAGDDELEVSAIELLASARAEAGDGDIDWEELEHAARRVGRWPAVVRAMRARAGKDLDDAPLAVPAAVAAAAELCEARGLTEEGAWCDYALAEAGLCSGRWDEALDAGLRAIALGEAHGFVRVVLRCWFALLPIAAARGRADLGGQARLRFPPRPADQPMSSYARMMVPAVEAALAELGHARSPVPDPELTLPSFELGHGGPSWLAAVEAVVGTWLAAGELATAGEALERMRRSLDAVPSSRFAAGVEALLRARLLRARGEEAAAEAGQAVSLLAAQPWWRAKAIRVLEAAAGADAELLAEAERLERALGIAAYAPG